MKIIFLGTGDADGIPALGCSCFICQLTRKNPSYNRSWASLFVSNGNTNIVVDPTPALRDQLVSNNLSLEFIDAFLITHWHFEHWVGLIEIHAWDRKGLRNISSKFTVLMNHHMYDRYQKVLPYFVEATNEWLETRFEFVKIQHYNSVKVKDLEIIPVELYHQISTTGYIIRYNDKSVAYLVDSGINMPVKTIEYVKRYNNLVILDVTWEKKESGYHMDINDALKFVDEVKPKSAYATHIGHKNLPHDELNAVLIKKSNGVLKAAHDGLIVKL